MMTLVCSRSLGNDRIGNDRIGSDRVELNQREPNSEPVKTLPNRIFYENTAGNQVDDRREPTNKDLQIIMHSLFQRMDQLELKFKTEKEIYQNILRGYVEGNEWFLNNIKPLLNDQRTNPIGLQNYPSSENMASQMASQLSNQQFQMPNQLNLEQNTNLDFNQPQTFPDVPPVSQSQVFMPQKPNLPFQNQRQNSDEEIRPSANTLQTEIQNDEPTNERSRPSQSAYMRQDSFPTTKLHGIQAGRPHKGLLMVYYNRQWGTVCDDHFGSDEADTACRSMGYAGAIRHSNTRSERSYTAPDNTPILLDELDCDKGQNSIFDCEAEWNHHNCNHGEDVIIECYPQQNIIR